MKRLFTPYIYIIIFLWNFWQLNAQDFTLKVSVKDSIENPVFNSLKYQRKHQSKIDLLREVDSLQLQLERFGYFNNRLDTLVNKDSIYTAHFFLGNSTKRIKISYDTNVLNKENLFQYVKKVTDTYFEIDIQEIPQVLNQLASFFEKQGKSFTTIRLNDILFEEDYLSARLNIETSKSRIIDKVILVGYENFPKIFLKNFIGLRDNSIFSTQKITSISERVKALPFVSESKSSEVLFTKDSTYLYLYLKKEKANRFDGLVGFTSDETNNKLNFNGYLDLELSNVLNGGENIRLNWRNNGDDRQVFNFDTELPYIFNSLLTPKFRLNIYKQDSTFINTNLNAEVSYLMNHKHKIGLVFTSTSSSNLLDIPATDVQDYNSNQYGALYDYRIFNNSNLFPIKFNLNTTIAIGNRESEGEKTNQSQINILTNYLWSLNLRNHLFIQNETAFLNSDDYLTNELFRIGGVNSIRGFNEESIFASFYSIVNLEYRYVANNSSYLYTISDAAFVNNELEETSGNIFSLGLGYAFRVGFGVLNLSYAIGKFDNQDFDFNNSRFHLKIIGIF